ncbi:MAG: TlpA family protein disulfide reductase [Phycisphaerales bacterium]|nr:TlpA family protein disulfide reductase [Phycisphaerales bacterium]MCB9863866.1 TlpA family protein disulfide reductase [Phycisphaerales bacterium]
MTRLAYVLAACITLVTGKSVMADAASAKKILAQAQSVAAEIKSISFDASFLGDGELGKSLPVMDAVVHMSRAESSKSPMIRIDGSKSMPRGLDSMPFRFVSNGVTAAYADDFRKVYMSGTDGDANPQERIRLVPPYYLTPDAFSRELEAKSLALGKPREVAGVLCHVVEVSYDATGLQRATICLGQEDFIVRSVIVPRPIPAAKNITPSVVSAEIFMARNVAINREIAAKSFSLALPNGYRVQPFVAPTPRRSNGMLAAGTNAPDWTLQDVEGNDVSLKSLRGKVVVIDFWASWCGPCKMAMPYLQKLHDKYKDKPVKVFSVNCRERRGDAAARKYIQDNKLTYPQLFNGDDTANAYMVRGIPTMYVIGTDGKILHAERGFRPDLVQSMSQVIDEHLKQPTAKADDAAKSEKTAKAG